ncbi:MAG: tetrahydromethanopterin S-methyltransferase subunit H [Candidatus Odinarchaeum yellowstonii]|uniref:Tetrahydromethanopterin S-methyltransferase subunit H n=1 Tax=Odinarchaeota yellowstonii (strain LCB_4) TaxID=1841599 RepID=A0AAF0D2Z7_ODILC|nr:MAG: tetrahydromethanopterin S-methyltransferase subunit H [Candidatus Odinarchaeum yellowstonii]
MIKFNTPQKIFEIGGVKIGGNPGERPIVLVGSIFYLGHRIVDKTGSFSFNKIEAAKLLNVQDELSEKTGNPCMVDLIISSPEAVEKEIDFIVDNTRVPLLLDPVGAETKIKSVKYVAETGLQNRVVYNSLNLKTPVEEFNLLKENHLNSALLLAYSGDAFTSARRIENIKKLIEVTTDFITKPLIDTYILDVPSLGLACKAMSKLKELYGFPVGGGTENAVATWKGLETKFGLEPKNSCLAAAAATAACFGADFILYGPIERCKYVFPTVAMVDSAIQQMFIEEGGKINRSLPLFKIG